MTREVMNEFLIGYRPRLLLSWYKLWKGIPIVDWIRAAELFRAANFKRAAFYYKRGLDRHPNSRASQCAKLDYGYCLYQENQLLEAVEVLQKLLNSGCQLKDAYLLLAKLQLTLGRTKDAASTMQKALSIAPEDIQVALCYAHVMFDANVPALTMKLVKDFVNTFRAKISLEDPVHVAVDTALATFECRYGDEEVGERLLSRALASGVAPFEAILLRGERWLEQGRIHQAREQLERAAKSCPADPRPYAKLAESYLLQGDFYEPEYAVQLATVSCKCSNWENHLSLDVLRQGYGELKDHDMVELIEERLRTLAPREFAAVEAVDESTKHRVQKHELM